MALAVTKTKTEITAQELWQLSTGDQKFELVKGELIEMTPPGGTHGIVALNLGALLLGFVKSKDFGEVMVESGYKLASNPDTVRGPDISFLPAEKIPADGLPDDYITGAPDLAVEVVSPGDTASEIQDKVQDYLGHGALAVWVVYPQQRAVIVHHPDGTARTLHDADILDGETVLPGFSCRVNEIFD